MTADIVIQPDLLTSYSQWGFHLRVEDGNIESLTGLGGITQPEEAADVLLQDPHYVHWRNFLWMHYTALLVRIQGSERTTIRVEGDKGREITLTDLNHTADRVEVGENGAVYVALYDPATEGEFRISPDRVEAGSEQRFTIEYTVGKSGIAAGGGIRVFTPYSSWSTPHLSSSDITLHTEGKARLESELIQYSHSVFGHIYSIIVRDDALREGNRITIRYQGKDSGITVQTYTKPKVNFPSFIDSNGDGFYYPFSYDHAPGVAVVPGAPAEVRIAAPMVVGSGEEFDVRALVLDECRNPVATFDGVLSLRVELNGDVVCEVDAQASDGRAVFSGVKLEQPGYYVLTVTGEGLAEKRLVVKYKDEARPFKLYWGAIHGHTDVSDGEFTPEEYYRYGKQVGMLDFCCPADHDWEVVEHERNRRRGGFEYLQKLANEQNEPGRCVTFGGYEWMGPDGHVNVYYNNDRTDNPIHVGDISVVDRDNAQTLAELIELYRGRDDVMLIPHSSHGQKWESNNDSLMPVVEMYSCWGCSEYKLGHIGSGAQEGLRRGYRFGFIGGADSHHGSPGHTGRPSKYHILPFREGFAAVYAEELTRDAVFQSMKKRACYATTAERILLEFAMNGVEMGGELRVRAGDEIEIKATVGGTASLGKIELVKNGEAIDTRLGSSYIEHYSYNAKVSTSAYYYIRVTQADGEMAWSSPVWVDVE